eukprot:3530544-Rhodomonas_salina.4
MQCRDDDACAFVFVRAGVREGDAVAGHDGDDGPRPQRLLAHQLRLLVPRPRDSPGCDYVWG